MDTIEIIKLFGAVVAIVGIPLTWWRVRVAERALRADVYFRVLEMLEANRDVRHLLEGKLPKPDLKLFESLSPDEQKKLDGLARVYDQVGLLVKHGAIPLDFLMDFYSRPLVVAWSRLSPHIRCVREQRGQPGHMVKFEMLAIEAKIHRDKHHKGEETFNISTEDNRRWKTWRK
ncbi:MAG: hypothetical protein HYY24_15415 [Verrucomicrobia bacterium]|nr:hypothetical protein [Verrucomicrobiota bacterium]